MRYYSKRVLGCAEVVLVIWASIARPDESIVLAHHDPIHCMYFVSSKGTISQI